MHILHNFVGHLAIYPINMYKDNNNFFLTGCPSPSLPGLNIAMGYVDRPFMKAGNDVLFEIRKKMIKAQVTKMPFVPTQYYLLKK